MDGAAVKELATRFRGPQELNGFILRPTDWVAEDPQALIKPGPDAEALEVSTLGAVRDYVRANRDSLALNTLVAHVVSPQIVRLSGPLQARARNRESYIEASAVNLTDAFVGRFIPIDEFIVGLQTRFIDTAPRASVLKLFGTVKHEGVKTLADDGVTQTVTAKAGIVLSSEVAVPSPLLLTPFRTFREVLQPESLFVLRVNGATAGTLTAGLFEADGGAWRLVAVDRVRDWLKLELPETVAVLA